MTEEEKKARDYRKVVKQHKDGIERSLSDVKRKRIPEPAYFFKVGDRVRFGAWDWSGVLEVCDDGKYYKLFSTTWRTKMNVPDHSGYMIHYVPWYETRYPIEVLHDEQYVEDDDIFFQYMQRDMVSIIQKMFDEYGIDLDPEYQRGNVWNDAQKLSLIDSIFKNIDIGKFTVIKRPWGNNPNKPETQLLYEMLDGKQRLTALFEFYCGRFKYKGKYFYELHPRDQGHFKHYRISYAECDPLTKEQKLRYFLKLNTGGTPVDPEHIKKVREMWEKERLVD